MGVMLAELLAYAGDNLSYQQDAVATEAYLLTARSRVSLRRHALLVDYRVHDGCNARAWVRLTVARRRSSSTGRSTRFYTFAPGMPAHLSDDPATSNEAAALRAGVVVFEPMHDANLYVEHNQMEFYAWGDTDCCLPRGATEATLLGAFPNLQAGDVLIFQEMLGPQTGAAADADLRHRCAVRLTAVTATNSQGQPLVDPLFEQGSGAPITSAAQPPTPVTEIRWSAEDALPFPVCISSTFLDSTGAEQTLTDVSTVFGNVVLADQGLTMSAVSLPVVPAPSLFIPAVQGDCCDPAAPSALPVRYWPALQESPVTQAVPLPLAGAPVTPTAVALLSDRLGRPHRRERASPSLLVGAEAPVGWPQYFGISVTPSAVTTGNIDLAVVYAPPGRPGRDDRAQSYSSSSTEPDARARPGECGHPASTGSRGSSSCRPATRPPAANPTTFPPDPGDAAGLRHRSSSRTEAATRTSPCSRRRHCPGRPVLRSSPRTTSRSRTVSTSSSSTSRRRERSAFRHPSVAEEFTGVQLGQPWRRKPLPTLT